MKDTLVKYLKSECSKRTGFGARAYIKFIKTIENYPSTIDNLEQLSLVTELSKGKIYDKCCQLITGAIVFIQTIEEKTTLGFKEELMSITAIGPAKVKELIDLGITNMDDLHKRKYEVLNDKQLVGVKYHEFDGCRIPREEIIKHNTFIEFIVDKLPNTRFEIVGSYRRGHPDSGDIDILLTNSKNDKSVFNTFINFLKKGDYLLEDDLAYGSVKYMGYSAFCGIPRRIDILYCSPEEYPFSMLYFTGSGEFNKGMRKWCLTNNYTLNEHGLYHLVNKKKGNKVDHLFNTETDIFNYLGFPVVEPHKRIRFNENDRLI